MTPPNETPTPPAPGKEQDNPDGKALENIKALQRSLTEKDKQIKALSEKLDGLTKKSDDPDKIAELTTKIESLTQSLTAITTASERELLRSQYPDVLPELLLGKTPEQIETLVTAQRAVTKKLIEDAPSHHAPVFDSIEAIEQERLRVTKDKSLSTDEKLLKVRELKNLASEF